MCVCMCVLGAMNECVYVLDTVLLLSSETHMQR
jgi:hypothetical protein